MWQTDRESPLPQSSTHTHSSGQERGSASVDHTITTSRRGLLLVGKMGPPPVAKEALLQLYKQLLRSAQTYPSKNRLGIYQAIREEWRDHKEQADEAKLNKQITIAYKGLSQLRQFDLDTMTQGKVHSANWDVQLEQNPLPKPADYDERKAKRKIK